MGLDLRRDLSIRALATNVGQRGAPRGAVRGHRPRHLRLPRGGHVAVECPAKDGLHIFEDAFDVRVVDLETGAARCPTARPGPWWSPRCYKTGSPQFRYNIMDLSVLYPREQLRLRQLAAAHGPVRRSRRQHGQAAGGQRLARGDRCHRHLGRGHRARLRGAGRDRRADGTSSSWPWPVTPGPTGTRPSPRPSARRLRDAARGADRSGDRGPRSTGRHHRAGPGQGQAVRGRARPVISPATAWCSPAPCRSCGTGTVPIPTGPWSTWPGWPRRPASPP